MPDEHLHLTVPDVEKCAKRHGLPHMVEPFEQAFWRHAQRLSALPGDRSEAALALAPDAVSMMLVIATVDHASLALAVLSFLIVLPVLSMWLASRARTLDATMNLWFSRVQRSQSDRDVPCVCAERGKPKRDDG
ncbi:unnamed protein product [Prorocentrum cordatum]|uniref:Uncharacterized protein n=1 Tax=Prorocentrum cordatum TaxID=2364126 RepID=A0ABN9S2J4_9DINO|nr:unnamed protein product [Polarella glacialis]